MLKNILTVLRKLASAAMNFLIVYFETIAVPMSWAMGGTIMFTMYTELSNIFNGAVCLLVGLWQLGCIFTGRELPLWLKRLKFISTSCLAMTLLTVVIILAPMYEDGNGWEIYKNGGRVNMHMDAVEWAMKACELGAGEILLTSMDCDGTKAGYDTELTRMVSDNVSIPVIASGGAGTKEHFKDAFELGGADAALAASLFHYKELDIMDLKKYLRDNNISVRM